MGKNLRLFLSFGGLIFIIFYLTKYANVTSQRELLLQRLFSIQEPLTGEWIWENEKWSFYFDAKSLIMKKSVWFILKSTPLQGDTNSIKYSLVNLKEGEVFIKEFGFLELGSEQKPKFELKKISNSNEALFFIEKKCQKDFCFENLKIYQLEPQQITEIGQIPLSASNLLSCKKEEKPCFEYFGSYLLEKNSNGPYQKVKIVFKGFEEDGDGKSKAVENEIYSFENGKYISESFKKFH